MNERIRELAEQATSIVEMVGPEGYTSSYAKFDREKFAELIIHECIQAVKNVGGYNEDYHMNAIKKYFGVEE